MSYNAFGFEILWEFGFSSTTTTLSSKELFP
jgi:hypothetical protein